MHIERILKEKIKDRTPIIFSHLYKIIGFGKQNPQTIHHWCAELGGFLKICNMKIKNKNKVIDDNSLTNTMFEVYSDVKEFTSLGGELYSKYGYSDLKDSEIYQKIKQVLSELIKYIQELNEDERVNPYHIEKLIEKEIKE